LGVKLGVRAGERADLTVEAAASLELDEVEADMVSRARGAERRQKAEVWRKGCDDDDDDDRWCCLLLLRVLARRL
jgi:hypothetical protein